MDTSQDWPGRSYVSRQPVLDRRLGIWAYDVLLSDARPLSEAGPATLRLVLSLLSQGGYERLVGERTAMMDIPLHPYEDALGLLPATYMMPQFSADEHDTSAREMADRFVDNGYSVTVDGYSKQTKDSRRTRAASVRLDLSAFERAELAANVKALRARGFCLIASRGDDRWSYEYARDLGSNYVQGYFFRIGGVRSFAGPHSSEAGEA